MKAFEWSSSSLEGIGYCWLFSSSSHTKKNRRFYIILKTNVNFSMNFLKTTERRIGKFREDEENFECIFHSGKACGDACG